MAAPASTASTRATPAEAAALPFFDRQTRIPGWQQEVVASQTAMVFGAGGIGTNIAAALCRLGVKKLFIIDFDVVDDHNLNRQTLYSKSDVDVRKVDAAARTLDSLHNLSTEIVPLHLNVIKQWPEVVAAARECNVIFNGIDVGDYWDAACQSLCIALGIPHSVAGTFQTMITADYFKPGGPCWVCMGGLNSREVLAQLHPSKILTLADLSMVPKDQHPTGASYVSVAVIAANLAVNNWVNELLNLGVAPTRSIFYLQELTIDKWPMEKDPHCPMCSEDAAASAAAPTPATAPAAASDSTAPTGTA